MIADSRLSFTIRIDNTTAALHLESIRGRTLAFSKHSRVDSVQFDSMAEVGV